MNEASPEFVIEQLRDSKSYLEGRIAASGRNEEKAELIEELNDVVKQLSTLTSLNG